MGLFDGIDNNAQVAPEKDVVRGAKKAPLASNIYNLVIKYVYGIKSKKGALGLVFVATTPDGREIKQTEYITTGADKGCKTYYEKDKKDGSGNVIGKERFSLPGFALMDSLAHVVLGKGITQCVNEKRTIAIYNFDSKQDVPTEVEMLVEFTGKGVCGAILHQIQDKTSQNAATGDYEPTGQTYATNVIDKFFDPINRKTAVEIANNIPGDFAKQWLDKWENQIDDQSTEVKGAGLKGAPMATGDAAPKTNLFA